MSIVGVLRLFRVEPKHPVGPEGQMALADHLRELRARVMIATVTVFVGMVVAWFFYDELNSLLLDPYRRAQETLEAQGVDTDPIVSGIATSLLLQIKISALASVVVTSPIWLYQIWAFIVPGLHPHERRSTKLFAVIAGPLFVAGVATAYYVLPKGMEVLLSFTIADVQSFVELERYLSFLIRMMLVFGVAFEIPLFVVMLNLAGVVSGATLGAYRPWIVLGTFVFAAVATPSTDPFTMIMLALPMTILFLLSEVVARLVDRRRARADRLAGLDDDEQSELDYRPEEVRRSDLGQDD
ncbi:MAG TPA: twin-arginine translocase subunit TatC [Nocardioides sp.]|uniref:twin-arginine translocase subunit TatC n=1 Tax=Nocardioides sp. TaxID=35761 RepID=UPI002D8074E0|nr:twin-arginine translocase subunit TatC [Nocardioides sp.]HET6651013.1 twin-arginine translocase subunit TatC [Nocardioides sp.]